MGMSTSASMAKGCAICNTPLGHGGIMQDNPQAAPKSTTSSSSDDPRAVSIIISCDTCVVRDSPACHDCIVPMLCGEPEAVIFDYEELRTLAALAKAGLTPGLRHQRSA